MADHPNDNPALITTEDVADFPDQLLEEGVNGLPELRAHVAILSKKGKKDEQLHPRAGFESGSRKP
jgi:hypothetical protein